MSTGKQFDDYIDSVLREVRFKEAHAEIRKELITHLEEAKEITSGLKLSEAEIESQVIQRMGNAAHLGATLDRVHRPSVDVLVLGMLAFLLTVGAFAMAKLDRIELHLLWLGLGMMPMVALTLIKPATVREWSWRVYAATVALGVFAAATGRWVDGQPFLSLGPVNVKVVDLSVALFVLALAGPLSNERAATIAKQGLLLLVALMPLMAYVWIGSFFPAVLLGSGCLAMMIVSRQPTVMVVGYSSIGAALVAASLEKGAFVSADRFSEVAAYELHTDFVFHFLTSSSPVLAVATIAVAVSLTTHLILISRLVRSPYGKTVSTGATALISGGVAWGALSNLGFVPMPVTGVYFPFLSYSGSLLVAHLILVGVVLGVQRRRSLRF